MARRGRARHRARMRRASTHRSGRSVPHLALHLRRHLTLYLAVDSRIDHREEAGQARVRRVSVEHREGGAKLLRERVEVGARHVEHRAVGKRPGVDFIKDGFDVGVAIGIQPRRQRVGEMLGARRVGRRAHHDNQAVKVGELVGVVEVVARGAAVRRDQVVLAGVKFQARFGVKDRSDRERHSAEQHQVGPFDADLR